MEIGTGPAYILTAEDIVKAIQRVIDGDRDNYRAATAYRGEVEALRSEIEEIEDRLRNLIARVDSHSDLEDHAVEFRDAQNGGWFDVVDEIAAIFPKWAGQRDPETGRRIWPDPRKVSR